MSLISNHATGLVPLVTSYDSHRYDVQWRRTALIICDLQRPGAWRDMMTMFEFFERNGFECKSEGRPTSQRLKATLREFRASLSNGYVSCFILVIMAHGVQGRIVLPVYKEDYYDYADYARECKNPPKMELAEIFQMFDNRQCPAMREKPKLFIVQACRADQCHSMGYPSLLCDSSGYPSPVHAHALLPTMSDYMIVYAAQPGKVAFRHPDHGSPLFTVLLDVVEEFGKTRHMREIFTKVTYILKERSRRDWALVGELNPPDSSLHVEDGLSKKWYLFHT